MSRRWKRGYLRKQRWRKIQNRIKVIKQLHPTWSYVPALNENTPVGKFAKGHYGFLGHGGTNTKTNTRKGHASYRHKGAYGRAVQYKPHDKRQVIDMDQQVNEIKKGK